MFVVGIGQCSWDYLAIVEHFPSIDTKAEVSDWVEQGGGPVATALVTLARLGIPCRFHGVVGDDGEGAKICRSLVSDGIGAQGVVAREKAASQKAFIAIEKQTGTRTIFWTRPSGRPLLPEEIPSGFLDGCAFLLLDGLMTEASLFAAEQAKRCGIPVMLDAGRNRPGMMEIAGRCDYLVAAEQFALDLGWDGTPSGFRALSEHIGAGVTTLTLGDRGSITFNGGEIITVPAFTVPVVDTTGAGDVFHGGYLYGLMRKLDLRDTILFASAAAALNCGRIGGRAGIPELRETLRFLEKNGAGMTI
jgi:sulfofructose kinase